MSLKASGIKSTSMRRPTYSHWPTLGAGFALALVALVIADWPSSAQFLSSQLCLNRGGDHNIFQMLVNEQAKDILKNRWYAQRGYEVGDVQLVLTREYTACLYEEASARQSDNHSQNVVARTNLEHDLRVAIEKIPFSEKKMTLKLECDREQGLATVTLHIDGLSEYEALVLNSRPLDSDDGFIDNSVFAAGLAPMNPSCL